MHIDPTQTSTQQTSRAHKGDDFRVSNCVRVVHLPVGGEESAATAEVAYQDSPKTRSCPTTSSRDREADRVRWRMAGDWQETIQTEVSARIITQPCVLVSPSTVPPPPPRDIPLPEVRCSSQREDAHTPRAGPQPLARCESCQCPSLPRCEFRLSKELIVDIKCLLHPYESTILIWMSPPGLVTEGSPPLACAAEGWLLARPLANRVGAWSITRRGQDIRGI